MAKKSVLFVCMGNICRSPAAEGVFRRLVADRGLEDRIHVDSAGTIGYHTGEPSDARMRKAAARRGYRLDGSARQFTRRDFDRFNLIIAMDRQNLSDIHALDPNGANRAKVRLFSDFLPDGSAKDVPDPYYGGAAGFETVLDMLEQASEPILHALLDGHGE